MSGLYGIDWPHPFWRHCLLPSPQLLSVSSVDNVEVFKAAQVAVGMLGVITEVTLQCEEAYHLEETLVPHPLHYCLENLEEVVHSSEYSKVWMELFSGSCATFLVNRTKEYVRTSLTMSVWDIKVWVSLIDANSPDPLPSILMKSFMDFPLPSCSLRPF